MGPIDEASRCLQAQAAHVRTHEEYIALYGEREEIWLDGINQEGWDRRYTMSLGVAIMLFGGNTATKMYNGTELTVAAFLMLSGVMLMSLMVSQVGVNRQV